MVVLPSGSFMMGSDHRYESPKHKVDIEYQLAVGVYEVTFEEWDACVAAGGLRRLFSARQLLGPRVSAGD